MMMISANQMDRMGQDVRRAGNLRMVRYIDERFPGILGELDTEERLAVVEKYRCEAGKFGFRADDEIGYFMDLVVMYGAPFPERRAFRPVMSDARLTAAQKVLRIKAMLRERGVTL